MPITKSRHSRKTYSGIPSILRCFQLYLPCIESPKQEKQRMTIHPRVLGQPKKNDSWCLCYTRKDKELTVTDMQAKLQPILRWYYVSDYLWFDRLILNLDAPSFARIFPLMNKWCVQKITYIYLVSVGQSKGSQRHPCVGFNLACMRIDQYWGQNDNR